MPEAMHDITTTNGLLQPLVQCSTSGVGLAALVIAVAREEVRGVL